MPRLPVVSGPQFAKVLERIGYELSHQTGSHMIMRSKIPPHRHISVPNHKELGKGLVRGLIRDVGLSVEEFTNLL